MSGIIFPDDGGKRSRGVLTGGLANVFDKIRPALPAVMAFLYAFTISLSALYNVVIPQNIPVSPASMICGCAAVAAMCTLFFAVKPNWIVSTASAAALAITAFILRGRIASSATAAFSSILEIYQAVDDRIPSIPALSDGVPSDATLFLLCIALVISFFTARAVLRAKTPWITIAICVLLLVCGMCVFHEEPSVAYFSLLIYALTLLVLTNPVRQHSTVSAAVLSLKLAPFAAALFAALIFIVSPADYERTNAADKVYDGIMGTYQKMMGIMPDSISDAAAEAVPAEQAWGIPSADAVSDTLDMSKIGPSSKTGSWAMSIHNTGSGTVYLRGLSYAEYSGNTWHQLPDDAAQYVTDRLNCHIANSDDTYEGTVSIRTSRIYPVLFTPYYPMEIVHTSDDSSDGSSAVFFGQHGDAYISNVAVSPVYTVDYGTAENGSGLCSGMRSDTEYLDFVNQYYLSVPDETAAALWQLADEAGITQLPSEQMPAAVAQYVRSSAEYSLDTPAAPDGADFAVWFLTESDTGYCMHYATVAALMLRSLGIPARYVTGYVITTEPYNWYNVLDDNAHAWVEYYDDNLGWLALEATPGSDYADNHENEQEPEDDTDEPGGSTSTTTSSSDTEQTETTTASAESDSGVSDSDTLTPQPASSSDSPQQPLPGEERFGAGLIIIAAVILLLLPLVLYLTRTLVLRSRQRRFETGEPNRRALAMWSHTCRICGLSGRKPPEDARQLALKARFSQHTLTDDELAFMRESMESISSDYIGSRNFIGRLISRYIMFID